MDVIFVSIGSHRGDDTMKIQQENYTLPGTQAAQVELPKLIYIPICFYCGRPAPGLIKFRRAGFVLFAHTSCARSRGMIE